MYAFLTSVDLRLFYIFTISLLMETSLLHLYQSMLFYSHSLLESSLIYHNIVSLPQTLFFLDNHTSGVEVDSTFMKINLLNIF